MAESDQISMVVFDWAGTTVDYASSAPMDVFKLIFDEAGISLTKSEINGPMGMEKKQHIRSLLSLNTASRQWEDRYNRAWTEEDVESLYQIFERKLYEVVENYCAPIDGVVETVKKLRDKSIKIGSTTGYNSKIMEKVIPAALEQGYEPDCVVTPDVTGMGRPTPFMINECMRLMNVYPASRVVKVGDTITDIKEGVNAGTWSVGILIGSNLLGLSQEELENLSEEELEARKTEATKAYMDAGADIVIDSICELPDAIEGINLIIKNRRN